MLRRKAVLSLTALLASVPLALGQGTYTQIDVPGASYTTCTGIDTGGDLIGTYGDARGGQDGFLLSGGIYTTVAFPGAGITGLNGVNDKGQIVGDSNGNVNGFLYDVPTQAFTTLSRLEVDEISPYAINNAGRIVGNALYGDNLFRGFELVDSKFMEIAPSATAQSLATGIDAAGTVTGIVFGSRNENFLFSQGKYVLLSIPNAPGALVSGISSTGETLVGNYNPSSGVTAGFTYQNKTLTTVQFPGSSQTAALGINDAGEVAGQFTDSSGKLHGFTWTPPAGAAKK